MYRGATRVRGPIKTYTPEPKSPTIISIAELFAMMKKLEEMHGEIHPGMQKLTELHDKFLVKVQEVSASLDSIKEGKPGRDATVDHELLAQLVAARIPAPKNGAPGAAGAPGKDAKISYKKLAKAIAQELPQPDALDEEDMFGRFAEKIHAGGIALTQSQLEGIRQTMGPLRRFGEHNGIRGGGDSVSAGTGVTITTLSTGQKQINASGGFTVLQATETPNGSRTTFTFAAATAQPTYIRSDGILMKATSKSGTVNWTWNNSTKVATMTIAPQDDIDAIV